MEIVVSVFVCALTTMALVDGTSLLLVGAGLTVTVARVVISLRQGRTPSRMTNSQCLAITLCRMTRPALRRATAKHAQASLLDTSAGTPCMQEIMGSGCLLPWLLEDAH